MNVVTAIVAYKSAQWIRVAIRSLRESCGIGNVLVIDNNPDADEPLIAEERQWLARERGVFVVKQTGQQKQHGLGIDLALSVCRSLQADYMLLLEPDCLFTGREWLDGLLEAAGRGVLMAGVDKKEYGPIHPALSIWRTSEEWPSFGVAPYGDDLQHPRFREIFNLDLVLQRTAGMPWAEARKTTFDTAQKAWFRAAVKDSAVFVKAAAGCRHFWTGSTRNSSLPDMAKQIARLAEFD